MKGNNAALKPYSIGAGVMFLLLASSFVNNVNAEPVSWKDTVNVSVGTSLVKFGEERCSGRAKSVQVIKGDGAVDAIVPRLGSHWAFGLGPDAPNISFAGMSTALVVMNGGSVHAYENGEVVSADPLASVSEGDHLQIKAKSNVAYYYITAQLSMKAADSGLSCKAKPRQFMHSMLTLWQMKLVRASTSFV